MKEEERALYRLAREGDPEASERLMEEHTGLIWSIVKRFMGRGVDPEDLYQLGCVGFLKAIRGFDEAYGTQFSTYAVPKITGEIRRFMRDDGEVKVSRTVKELAARIRYKRTELMQQSGKEPTLRELAEAMGLTVEEIASCETAVSGTESLQRETAEGFTLEQVIGDYGAEERLLERVALKEAIEALPDRERKVILLRYFRDYTQVVTAEILGISQVQVSRLEKKAVTELREKLA